MLSDVHLAEQAKCHNAVGVGGMRGKAPNSCIWLGGEWQHLPSLPEVCGAEHVPLFARRGLSTPGEQHARIIGLDHDPAGLGQRPFLLDAQRLPGVAQIIADKHFPRYAGVYALGLRRPDRHGVNIRVLQTRLEVRPRVATVQAAEDAVNFYPCQTRKGSSGSTTTPVTKGVPIEHSRAMSRGNFSHCRPPSRER